MTKKPSQAQPSDAALPSSFVIRHSSFRAAGATVRHSSFRAKGAFTILELLIVMTIIIALAGLIIATVGYVQKKGARSRTEAEIAAMSAALESYKADNGVYARNADTDAANARAASDFTIYQKASQYLYGQLTGDPDFDGGSDPQYKAYIQFKPNQLSRPNMSQGPSASNKVIGLRDPFGNSYGYSTAYQKDIDQGANPPTHGYNPTFDLWSTGGDTSGNTTQWIKNW
jgi:type II secretory pathway pseudopilin PulG